MKIFSGSGKHVAQKGDKRNHAHSPKEPAFDPAATAPLDLSALENYSEAQDPALPSLSDYDNIDAAVHANMRNAGDFGNPTVAQGGNANGANGNDANDYDDDDYDDYDEDDEDEEDEFLTPTQRRKRLIRRLIVAGVAIVAACISVAAVYDYFVQPPSFSTPTVDTTTTETETETFNPEITEAEGDGTIAIQGDRIDDFFTFVIAVTDIDGYRTDNLLVGAFDTTTDEVTINLMNIPRDTMSVCDRDGASRKINTAYGLWGGIDNTMDEISNIVGFTPDRYVVLSFEGVADIVDAIGGVEFDVPFLMIYDDPYQDLHIYLEPGVQTLDGEQAVDYLRWRKNNSGYTSLVPSEYDGSDTSRIEKMQEFILTVAEEVLQVKNVLNVNEIVSAVFNSMDTSFTTGEILWMATQCLNMDTDNINMMTLPGYAAYSYADTDDYLSFYFPNTAQTLAMVNAYFNPYDKDITSILVYSSPPEPDLRVEEDDDLGLPENYTITEDGFLLDEDGVLIVDADGLPLHIDTILAAATEDDDDSDDTDDDTEDTADTDDTENEGETAPESDTQQPTDPNQPSAEGTTPPTDGTTPPTDGQQTQPETTQPNGTQTPTQPDGSTTTDQPGDEVPTEIPDWLQA